MTAIIRKPDTQDKLSILSTDAQYDLACACGTGRDEHRVRGASGDGRWIYPVTLPNGGTSFLFKTLVTNVCGNDCRYCPLRGDQDVRRVSLSCEETVRVFLDYLSRGAVSGLFLSSGVMGSADATMEKMNTIARILRTRHKFRGFIHLKILPGASAAAIEEAVSLAGAVSLNIETPGESYMRSISSRKNYLTDIIEPIKLISRLTQKGSRYARVKQTTQFIVGAAGESDERIVHYMHGLYDRLGLNRIYFSAYQRGLGTPDLPGEAESQFSGPDRLMREHRLYQVDFLMRKYGFGEQDISYDPAGRLDLTRDPKELWALNHPEAFPVNANRAGKMQLLRVPGLGPVTVSRMLARRRQQRLRGIEDVGRFNKRLEKAMRYLTF